MLGTLPRIVGFNAFLPLAEEPRRSERFGRPLGPKTGREVVQNSFPFTVTLSVNMMGRIYAFLACALFVSPCISWTQPAYMDLGWPQRYGDTYMSKNGTFLSPNYLNSCLNLPVPSNQTRTLFPIQRGRLQLDLVNRTGGPPDETYAIDLYLAHIQDNLDDRKGYNKIRYTFTRWGPWQNFSTETNCSQPLNMTEMIQDENGNQLKEEDLAGLNVTLAL